MARTDPIIVSCAVLAACVDCDSALVDTANVCGMVYGYGDCTTHQQSACQFTVNNLFVASLGQVTRKRYCCVLAHYRRRVYTQYQPPAQPVWSLLDQSNPFAGVQQTFTNVSGLFVFLCAAAPCV